MNKAFLLSVISALCIIMCALSISAAPAGQKTYSVSTHLTKLMVSGYGFEAEYHGLGQFGLFAGGYHSLYYTVDGMKSDLSGFGFNTGTKYYLNYQKKGLDSFFIGAEYRFLTEHYSDSKDRDQEVTRSGCIAMFGRRFQFSMAFIELAVGGGPMYIHKMSVDDEYLGMSSKDIDKMRNSEHNFEGGMDLKVMAGIAL